MENMSLSQWTKTLDKAFRDWKSSFILNQMNKDISSWCFASYASFYLTMGVKSPDTFEDLQLQCTDQKLLSRIEEFQKLKKNAINRPKYDLSSSDKELDEAGLKDLIENSDKPIYLNFWSARYAGASTLPNLSSYKIFEERSGDNLKVIHICVEEKEYKGLWAANIVDNQWVGNHYFMPVEGADSIMSKFNVTNISTFCNGGATFSMIAEDGTIINNVSSPLMMTKQKLGEYLEQARN